MDNDNEEAPEEGFVPPSAESIGHEGPDAPVAERLKKYEAELAAMVKRRAEQLEDASQIKDPQKRLGFRTRSTWYHLIDVREERLPIYEH